MKRRQAEALLLGIVLCITACMKAPVPDKREVKRLELWYYLDTQGIQSKVRKVIERFNSLHTDIEVVPKYIPEEDFKKQMALAIADGVMPPMAFVDAADLFYFDSLEPLVEMSEIVDESAYMDVALKSCRKEDGRLLGIPVGIICLNFFYNEDLLQQANVTPPKTLEEFAAAAVKLTSDKVYGCAFPSLQNEETIFSFLPVLWAMGGSLEHINSEESHRAFELIRWLSEQGAMSNDSVHMTMADIAKEFIKGNLAMMFNASLMEPLIRKENPQLHFAVDPLPTGEENICIVSGEVLVLMDTGNVPEAMEFASFLAEPENMKVYLDDLEYLSPRKDLLEWQAERDVRNFTGNLKTARTRDYSSEWPMISTEVTKVINQVILGEDQEDTLEKLEEKISKIEGGKP